MLVSMCLGMLIMCFILCAELIFEPLDKDGLIKDILVNNGEAIEFGQPLFEIS